MRVNLFNNVKPTEVIFSLQQATFFLELDRQKLCSGVQPRFSAAKYSTNEIAHN